MTINSSPPISTPMFVDVNTQVLSIPWGSWFSQLNTQVLAESTLSAITSAGITCYTGSAFTTRTLTVGDGLAIALPTGATGNPRVTLDIDGLDVITSLSNSYVLIYDEDEDQIGKISAQDLGNSESIIRTWMGV